MTAMDATDRKILTLLQENVAQPVAEIARKVGLSVTPCWRRIQRLEETGVIRKRVALLDPQKIGVGMSVFVAVRTDQHNADWLQNFATMISDMPEVVEFYRMSGEVDYLLRVVVADMAAYDAFYRTLIGNVQLTDVSSSFAMEETTISLAKTHGKPRRTARALALGLSRTTGRPADRSASMAICLPGMASSVKRAPTSAMRVAPLVMTMKLTVTRIRNTIRPMTKSPLITRCENPLMT